MRSRSQSHRRRKLALESLEPRILLSVSPASSFALQTLSFYNTNSGSSPVAGLIADSHGNLFGTTPAGGSTTALYGSKNVGTVFEIPAGTNRIVTLASFDGFDGANPQSGLFLDGGGNLFGTTFSGGAGNRGTVFEIAAGSNAITPLASFMGTNGYGPKGGVAVDGSGNLYGTTEYGGAKGAGTVFEIAAGSNAITTLASFNGPNGASPVADLILDGSGNLFGTTFSGGAKNLGTVFEIMVGTTTINTLASFTGTNGNGPQSGLIVDGSGNLFGTTEYGGAKNLGTVFEIAAGSNAITTLASFGGSNGSHPVSGLALDGDGNLYGTTEAGGAHSIGTAFEIKAGATAVTLLASFAGNDGNAPKGAVVLDAAGNLYGTTEFGGAYDLGAGATLVPSNRGTVFEIAAGSSAVTTLASFTGSTGTYPSSGLVLDGSDNLYGTTKYGGVQNSGTVFEIAAGSASVSTLASFGGNLLGGEPQGQLMFDAAGNLFGTTQYGGAHNDGTVFELKAGASAITVLASFGGANGLRPQGGVVLDANGNLYGTTQYGGAKNLGTVFELAAGSGTITTLASFTGPNGSQPMAGLVLDGSGDLFGTTKTGGAHKAGTVFEIAAGSNALTTLASFNGSNGSSPMAGVVLDGSGDLFGTAYAGGAHNVGTVFEIAAGSGAITALASFNGANGEWPMAGLVMDAGGNLYGTAWFGGQFHAYRFSDGAVFEVAAGSHAITPLASFSDYIVGYGIGSNGAHPEAGLVMDANGNLFGTTKYGGPDNVGTFFELTQPAGKLAFVQPPTDAQTGKTMSPAVTVAVEDAASHVITIDNSSVTLTISSGGTLHGTLTEHVFNGVATFSDLSVTPAGTYRLTAQDSADGLSGFTSGSFTIGPVAMPLLVSAAAPASGAAGILSAQTAARLMHSTKLPNGRQFLRGATLTPMEVAVEDPFGNVQPVVTPAEASVTVSVIPEPVSIPLLSTGTLNGITTEPVVNGVATFSNLSLSAAGFLGSGATPSLSFINSNLAEWKFWQGRMR